MKFGVVVKLIMFVFCGVKVGDLERSLNKVEVRQAEVMLRHKQRMDEAAQQANYDLFLCFYLNNVTNSNRYDMSLSGIIVCP